MMSNVLQSNSKYSQVNDKSSKWWTNDYELVYIAKMSLYYQIESAEKI